MNNIFRSDYINDIKDEELITEAQKGSKTALENLIKAHQELVYNIAVRMVGSHEDAQDVTQEILVKMITGLSTFQNKSSFRTWLYRIVVNHVLNMKRRVWERIFVSLEKHSDFKDRLEKYDMDIFFDSTAETDIIIEETKTACMTGMLLCLDRTQRLVFILGSILGVDSKLGGEFMHISDVNFRKILSRARKQLGDFMNEQCGLMNENNSCRCSGKVKACIKAGLVDPDNLTVKKKNLYRIQNIVSDIAELTDNAIELKTRNLFRDHPFYSSPDFVRVLDKMLNRKEISQIINFN